MWYRISVQPGYLKAELFQRRTAGETREFLAVVAAEGVRLGLRRGLISVRDSVAIFSLERFGFSAFVELAKPISDRIALTADSRELRLAQEYAALLARWRGINVQTFRDEAAALEWLTDRREERDRRQRQVLIYQPERRAVRRRSREARLAA